MTSTVELPLWLFILILLFAAVTAASHLFFPSVRWFLRRRMERVVSRLNERLARPIQPFKLLRRQDTILRLVYDPEVTRAIIAYAEDSGLREDVAFQMAKRYAREIVPSFSATAYFGIATRVSRWLSTALYSVKLGHFDEEAIHRIDADATVVFVMNHRSNMDYVLVTYLAAEQSALSYAVGEWARVWPLSQLFRAMGAYFIRRRSRNLLYRKILARYVMMATNAGVTQAVFPEGGLSLDGAPAQPRMGLLSYMVSGYRSGGRDVVFVPVALNYDRVLEDRNLIAARTKRERRFRGSLRTALGFMLTKFWHRITGRARRFGFAAVSFGAPLSLAEFAQRGEETTEAIAEELMSRIASCVPVLPVPLVALAIEGRQLDRGAIATRAADLLEMLERAHVHLPGEGLEGAVAAGLEALLTRGILRERAGVFSCVPGQEDVLDFYANSIRHHVADKAAHAEISGPEET